MIRSQWLDVVRVFIKVIRSIGAKIAKVYQIKVLLKGDEINGKKSNFPKELHTPSMLQYADKALRLEVTVCSRALREWQINMPCNWSLDTGKLIL